MSLENIMKSKTIADPCDYKIHSTNQRDRIKSNPKKVNLKYNPLVSAIEEKFNVDIPKYINSLLRRCDIDRFKSNPIF